MSQKKRAEKLEDVNCMIQELLDASEGAYQVALTLGACPTTDLELFALCRTMLTQSKTILMKAKAIAVSYDQLHLWQDRIADDLKDLDMAFDSL